MNKFLLFTAATFIAATSFGQGQIGNGDMEAWIDDPTDAPDNWNSFLTGSGLWSGAASDQCDQSSDARPGSAGVSSCYIWSTSTFGIIANGNVTLGRIEMGSTTPTSPNNYNYSITADSDHSQALTDQPDSIVFWVKFSPNGGNGNARMKATLHTDYDYRDPEDAAAAAEVVAQAVDNFPSTNGNWERHAVAFDYSGPASVNEYILVTFTTNELGGGGDAGDEVWVDDVELIYNPAGGPTDTDGDGVLDDTEVTDATDPADMCSFILASVTEVPSAAWIAADCDQDGVTNGDEVIAGTDPLITIGELDMTNFIVSMNNETNMISIQSQNELSGTYEIYSTMGQIVQSGDVAAEISFNEVSGIYFVHITTNNGVESFEILKH
ncbi:MAG: T9SS type A sorting domain-containing protein [Crocinitomicaceae bacterium]|nr:T9SS type A sorting domain-containing protein [Crocinitomicaceae bacterium]